MKQKVLSLLLIITIVYSLSGCFFKEPVLINERILKYTDKELVNVSNTYTIEDTSIALYHNEDNDAVSYVDIEEYVAFLGGGLLNYNVFKEDELRLDFRQIVPTDVADVIDEEVLIFEIVFNHIENTVYTSDLDLFTRLNLVHSISSNDNVELIEMISNDTNPEITIDLDDYAFDILYENDHYYLPFYLANLFLTGTSVNFYETDDTILLFDYGVETDQVREFYTSSSLTLEDVQEDTNNYLALYFDYFYGLKEHKEIDSFSRYLEDYNLDEKNTFIDHYEAISDFVNSLDDLHSRILDTGHLLPEYVLEDPLLLDSKVETYSIAYQRNDCSMYPEDLYYEEIEDGTHLFKIPAFTFDTGTEVADYVSLIEANDDVIIDLTCNTGGSLQGVVETLLHFTDQAVPIRHINTKTNQLVEEFYENNTPSLDADLFVLTSGVTYSAAHVFSSIVMDLEMGTVIGNPTLGGSCALVFTVLPNGIILSNSSYMTFVNDDFEIDEDGIDVDLTYNLPYAVEEIINDIDSYYSIATEYYVEAIDLLTRTRITFNIMQQDDAITPIEYVLIVTDTLGNEVYTETFTSGFSSRFTFGESIELLNVELKAIYLYDLVEYEDVIFYQAAQD